MLSPGQSAFPADVLPRLAASGLGRRGAIENLDEAIISVARMAQPAVGRTTCAEILHFFLAEYSPEARTGGGGGVREEGEEIALLELPLARAWEMVRMGEIRDAKTVLLLQHLLLLRGGGLPAGGG